MNTQINIQRCFWLFILAHLLIWTLAPSLSRHVLPLDALEGTTWGAHFAWGYDKDPFMNAWLTEWAIDLGGLSGWLVYSFSAIATATGLWAIWRFAKSILSPTYALVIVMMMEGINYYNFGAIDFDDNVLQLPFWSLMILYFYLALKHNRLRDWLLLGLFSALTMMSKYYVVVLFATFFCFMLVNTYARQFFKKRGPYISGFIFLILITPHVIWLTHHHYLTVAYSLARTHTQASHFMPAWNFTLNQLEAFIPSILFFIVLILGSKKHSLSNNPPTLKPFETQYLWIIGIGPLALTVLVAIAKGMNLHPNWGSTLLCLWPCLLVVTCKPIITKARLYRFMAVIYLIMLISGIAYGYSQFTGGQEKDTNFPAYAFANTLTKQWQQRYHTRLNYIAGPRTIAGIAALYSKDRPSVYMSLNKKTSFWINEKDFREKGAIFILSSTYSPFILDQSAIKRYPRLSKPEKLYFHWLHDNKAKSIEVTIAFLPPKHH